MYDFFAKLLMYDFFVKLLNMSLAASIIVLVIVVLRLLLKKAPKNIICVLWALVALRLILPFSIQSDMSAFNMMQSAVDNQGQIEYFQYNGKTEKPLVEFSVPALVNDNMSPDSMTIGAHTSDLYLPPVISIWLAGVCVMILYAIVSYLYLRKKVGASITRQKGLKMSDDISTPFILGILKPVIYIPSGMDEKTLNHVIAHEEAHIKRKDHWWKPLGYFLLTVYWFNPMIWLAYILLCRDIEMACDEKVIRDMDKGSVAEYSQALLDCSVPRRRIAACPLAFGEVGVKDRIKSMLNYKKPAFWIIIAAIVACAVVAVCFLTNPAANRYYPMTGHSISDLEPNQIVEWIAKLEKLNDAADLNTNSDNFDILLTSDFDIQYSPAIRYYFTEKRQVYCGQLRMFTDENRYFATKRTKWTEQNRTYKLQTYLEALKYLPQEQIRQLSPNADSYSVMIADGGSLENNARTISYTSTGVCSSDGWQIHLLVQPLHGGNGDGSEEIHLFYDATAVNYPVPTRWFDALHGDEMVWDGRREINLDEFPGVTFRWFSEKLEAVTEKETITLYTGMPIWSVYFCDLNGDGKPEICSSISFGSGMIDNRIIVTDYANKGVYELSDRGDFDYYLTYRDGQLWVEKRASMQDAVLESGLLMLRSVVGTDGTATPMLMIGQSELQNPTNADIVQVIEENSNTEESSYRVEVALSGTDFSSVGQMLEDKITQEWKTHDGMTKEALMLSSRVWGLVCFETNTWNEFEEAIGLTVDNPLESLSWLNKTGYFGMESADPSTPIRHIEVTADTVVERKLNRISVTSGYNTESARITLTATLLASAGTYTKRFTYNGYATYEQNTAMTGSGIPVLIVITDGTNNTGYYNGDYYDPTAYWVKDNVFYTLRVIGDSADKNDIQATIDRILAEI